MKRIPITTPCRCRDKQCEQDRLTQLHLKAESDEDVQFLEMIVELFDQRDANPERVAFVIQSIREPVEERIAEGLDKMHRKLWLAEGAPNN